MTMWNWTGICSPLSTEKIEKGRRDELWKFTTYFVFKVLSKILCIHMMRVDDQEQNNSMLTRENQKIGEKLGRSW